MKKKIHPSSKIKHLFSFSKKCMQLLILSLAAIPCYAQSILDVETLPTLRTQQYSMNSYKKIVIFSGSRTGSSLIHNVFRFLFQNEKCLFVPHNEFNQDKYVLKTHRYIDIDSMDKNDVLYVVPIRHPLDACISACRIRSQPIANARDLCKDLMSRQIEHLKFAEKLKATGNHVIFLKYEDFTQDLSYLLDDIETLFSISIAATDKALIKAGYSKENIYFSIRSLPSFRECLPLSGFHGKHVSFGSFNPSDKVMYWLHYHLQQAKPIFAKYGYSFDDI